jgi:hypothetical protein
VNSGNPWRIIAAIPERLKSQRVFNEYSFGGPLILSGIKVYIDGRAEMYGDAFVTNYSQMTKNDFGAFERTVRRYNIQWVMLPLSEKYLVREIRKSGIWCEIYRDQLGMIAVKKVGLSGDLCSRPTRTTPKAT